MKIFKYGDKEISYLKKADPLLGKTIDRIGPIEREVRPNLFNALIRNIIGQQISSKAADTIWNRFINLLGEVSPETIEAYSEESLQACGLSFRKISYIKSIAASVLEGELDLNKLHSLPDQEVIEELTKLKGVGIWTAEMLMIFSMERPDIVSWGDLAIKRGMSRLYNIDNLTKKEFDFYRERYSPYGSTASLYLWAISQK